MNEPIKVNELLKAIQEVNKNAGYSIWIPSLKKDVRFSDITTGQQKEMIRALVDNPVYRTNFIMAMYEIIKSNCQEDIDINKLSIFDKIAIAIQLRRHSSGNLVKVEVDNVIETVDLSAYDPKEKFTVNPELLKGKELEQNGIKVSLQIPTIYCEVQLETQLRAKLTKSNIESYDDVRNVLADAYVGELAKYITNVVVNGQGFMFDSTNFSNAYKVVEVLPTTLVRQAISYMEDVQRELTRFTTFSVVNIGLKTEQTVELSLDAAFFAGK